MEPLARFALAATLLLTPVQFLTLPMNASLADIAGLVGLPLCWTWMVLARREILLPFLPAMMCVMLGTVVASFYSPQPMAGLAVMAKEVYLYFLLVTVASVFAALEAPALRQLLVVWCVSIFCNGVLILAQFVEPGLQTAMNARLAGIGMFDPHRPSGLMANCNAAAFLQLSGFVPLLSLGLPPVRLTVLASLLLLTILATGSMGAVLAASCGAAVGFGCLLLFTKNLRPVLRLLIAGALALGLLLAIGLALLTQSPELQRHFEWVFYGRSQQSATSRFEIWRLGLHELLSGPPFWGIGPDMSKKLHDHEMHNDLLSFAVERGITATLGLLLFCYLVAARAMEVLRLGLARSDPFAVIYLAGLVAFLVHAQTHEIFHLRSLWLVLALQEALARRLRQPAPNLP